MPPPAPWVSTSVAIGLFARRTTTRASPFGVATIRSTGIRPPRRSRARRARVRRHVRRARLDGQGLEQLGAVVAHVGDQRAHRERLEPTGRRGLEQVEQLVPVAGAGIEPSVVPLAEAASAASGRGCGPGRPPRTVVSTVHVQRNRCGSSSARVGVAPDLVQPGHRQHATVRGPDEVGLLAWLAALVSSLGGVPLEVAVGRQDGAALLEGRRYAGFSATVSIRALIIRLPMDGSLAQNGTSPHVSTRSWRSGSRAPAVLGLAGGRPLDHGVDLLGRRHVVVRLERRQLGPADLELLDEVLRAAGSRRSDRTWRKARP